MKKLVISIVLLNLLAACNSTKAPDTNGTSAGTSVTDASSKSGATVSGANGDAVSSSALRDAALFEAAKAANAAKNNDPTTATSGTLAQRSIYYGLDVDAVAEADKAVIQAHAKYLSEHANRKVELVGSADERGSNEYNLALGQRRADGVKKLLELGGAKSTQLNAISYGEEKPKAVGHDEAAWSQNRRTDLNYAK